MDPVYADFDEPYIPKPKNIQRRVSNTSSDGHPSDLPKLAEHVRRDSTGKLEPRSETVMIPCVQNIKECFDPRKTRPLVVSRDLPVPELIDCVDFRVTFTINGVPYTPMRVDAEVERIRLPDLPSIPLPKLSSISDPRDPRDPRRRLSQSSYPVIPALSESIPLWAHSTPSSSEPVTPTRKKISFQDYLKKSEKPEAIAEKPIDQSNAVMPVIYGPEV